MAKSCLVPKETSCWQKSPALRNRGSDFVSQATVKNKFKPDILGSSPRHSEAGDLASTKLLHAAMRASYPNDVEISIGDVQPVCINHSFVLQQSSTSTLYGVALKVWSKADEKRAQTIRELRTNEHEALAEHEEVYWIPCQFVQHQLDFANLRRYSVLLVSLPSVQSPWQLRARYVDSLEQEHEFVSC